MAAVRTLSQPLRSTAASCPAPGKAAQENRTSYLIWQMGNYSSCRRLLLHPSRCGAPFVIVCESRKGGHRAEWELIAWMPAGLGRQPGLWVIAHYSFSGCTPASHTPGSLQRLPSYWENWSAPREEEEHQQDVMQVVGEDVSHTPSLWICGCSSNYFQQSVKEVEGVLEEPVGSKATGKEEKGMKPHVCRCSLVKNSETQRERRDNWP